MLASLWAAESVPVTPFLRHLPDPHDLCQDKPLLFWSPGPQYRLIAYPSMCPIGSYFRAGSKFGHFCPVHGLEENWPERTGFLEVTATERKSSSWLAGKKYQKQILPTTNSFAMGLSEQEGPGRVGSGSLSINRADSTQSLPWAGCHRNSEELFAGAFFTSTCAFTRLNREGHPGSKMRGPRRRWGMGWATWSQRHPVPYPTAPSFPL